MKTLREGKLILRMLVESLLLAAFMLLSLAACGNDKEAGSTTGFANDKTTEAAAPDASQGGENTEAVDILKAIWDSYADADKFSVFGGDYNHTVDNMPGKFDMSDETSVNGLLHVPADAVALVDDAASLIHMLNANTFTSSAYHVTDAANVEKFVSLLKDSLVATHWICGAPQNLVIATIDGSYVVCFLGAEDIVAQFKTQLQSVFPDADLTVEHTFGA